MCSEKLLIKKKHPDLQIQAFRPQKSLPQLDQLDLEHLAQKKGAWRGLVRERKHITHSLSLPNFSKPAWECSNHRPSFLAWPPTPLLVCNSYDHKQNRGIRIEKSKLILKRHSSRLFCLFTSYRSRDTACTVVYLLKGWWAIGIGQMTTYAAG